MLRPRSQQSSFYGSYLYDRIIPEDHLLRKVNQVVDFSFIHDTVRDCYSPDFGRPAEDPEFMLRLCLLQYLYGDSDRKVVENARVNMAYKYFLGLAIDDEVPDNTTLSLFRAQRLGEQKFREVFQGIVNQCIDKGLVTGQRQIIDSTHIVADMAINSLTGLIKMCRYNVVRSVKKQNPKAAGRLELEEVTFVQNDKYARKEDNLQDQIDRATSLLDSVTEELGQGRLKASPDLVKDLELLEKAVADRDDNSTDRLVSPTDPDARMGRKESKRWTGYKGHFIVEEDSEIITAVETTPGNVNDGSELKGLLRQQEQAFSFTPEELSGDRAYDAGANLEYLDFKKITGTIPLTRKVNHYGGELFSIDDFTYAAEKDTLTCPAGCIAVRSARAVFHSEKQKKKGRVFNFGAKQCSVCELKGKCNVGNKGRSVYISYYHPLYQQMKERLNTEEGQASNKRRMRIEHKLADLARYCGMRRSRYRGLVRTRIHTLLAAITSNIKRMVKLLCADSVTGPPIKSAAC